MRASDAERERVAETLREAVAEGRLEMDEFEQRLDATFKARTHGELVPLVRDLPVPGDLVRPVGAVAERKGSSANWPARIGGTATSSGAFAFWGGFSRKGRWTVGPKFTAFAMWGGGEIDLREARFAERDVVIRCFTIMGGMQVTVPPDLNVQVNGLGIMGGFGENSRLDEEPEPAPDSPRVKVTGFALMGGVGVERKRSRAEKRRLQEQEQEQERLRLQKPDTGGGRKELG
ncbi:DUF1707 domain-containing protein [Streptomyces sp. NPDC048438]|uniref:DUF1707 SHOCT-like domain-containing protein n=1 Tax=Streptomyces sp. NPDC048438 TaxID=3365551 RepID=UPI0037242B24